MNEQAYVLSPDIGKNLGKAHALLSEDEDEVSSLQGLINILRKPHEVLCTDCWGSGTVTTGRTCNACHGSGKKLST